MILHTIIQTVLYIIIKLLSIAIPAARKLLPILGKILQRIAKLKFIKYLWILPLKYIKKFLKAHTVQRKSSKCNSEDSFLPLLNPKHSNLREKVKRQIPICTDGIACHFHTANTPENSDSEESEEMEEKKRAEKSEEASEQKETMEMEVTETSTNPPENATALCNIEQEENQPEIKEKTDETVKAIKRKANESPAYVTKRKKSPDTSQPETAGIWCSLPRFPTSQLDSNNIVKDTEIEGTKSSKTENLALMDVKGTAESNLNNNKVNESALPISIQYTDNLHSGVRGNQSSIASFEDPVNAGTEIQDMETGEHSTSEASPIEQSGSSAAKPGASCTKSSEEVSKASTKQPEEKFLSPSKLKDSELEIIATLPSQGLKGSSEIDSDETNVDDELEEFEKGNIPEKVETAVAVSSEVRDNPEELKNRNKLCEIYESEPKLQGLINKMEQNFEAIKSTDITDFFENKVVEFWREKLDPESCDVTESTDKEDSKRVCGDNRTKSHENQNVSTAVSPIKEQDKKYRPFPGMAPDPKKVKKDAKYQKKFYRQQRESMILKKGESTEDRPQSSQIASESPSDEVGSNSAQIVSESPSDEGSSKSVLSVFKHPSEMAPAPENVKKDAKYQKKFYRQGKESTSLKKEDIEDHSQSSQIVSESPSGEDSSRPVPSGIGSPSGEARSQNVDNENKPVIHKKKLGNVIDECVENLLGYKRPSAEKKGIYLFSDRYRARYIPPSEFNLSELVVKGASSGESDIPETSMSSLSESSRSFAPSDSSLLPSTRLQTSNSAEATGSDPLQNSDKNKQTKTSDPPSDIESKEHSIPSVPVSENQSREISEHKTKEISIEEYLVSLRNKDGSSRLNLSEDVINNITKPMRCDPGPDFDLELVGESLQPSSHEHTQQTMPVSSVLTEQETSTSKVASNAAQIALDETNNSGIPPSTPHTRAPVESKSDSIIQEKESFDTSTRKITSPTSEKKAEELPEHDKVKTFQTEHKSEIGGKCISLETDETLETKQTLKSTGTYSDLKHAASLKELSPSLIEMREETSESTPIEEEQQKRPKAECEETPDLDQKTNKSEFISIDGSNSSQGEQTSSFHKKGAFEQHLEDAEKLSLSSEKKLATEPQIYAQDHGDIIRSEMECEESPTMECEESHEMECEAARSTRMECEESHEMECEATRAPRMECEESREMECEQTSELNNKGSESFNLSEGCPTQRKLELKNEKPELGEQNKTDKTASINLGKDSESQSLQSLTLRIKETVDIKEISEQPDSTETDVHESPLDQPMSEDADENPNVAESNQGCESAQRDSNDE